MVKESIDRWIIAFNLKLMKPNVVTFIAINQWLEYHVFYFMNEKVYQRHEKVNCKLFIT